MNNAIQTFSDSLYQCVKQINIVFEKKFSIPREQLDKLQKKVLSGMHVFIKEAEQAKTKTCAFTGCSKKITESKEFCAKHKKQKKATTKKIAKICKMLECHKLVTLSKYQYCDKHRLKTSHQRRREITTLLAQHTLASV